MKQLPILVTILFMIVLAQSSTAQSSILDHADAIIPLVSTRSDVISRLGNGELEDGSVWFYKPGVTVEAIFSDGGCKDGWKTEKDRVMQISIFFVDRRPLSELRSKVELKPLRFESAHDIPGERIYYDDVRGLAYGVNESSNEWLSLRRFAPKKKKGLRCRK